MKFTKMQALGNDYVYVNCFEQPIANPAELAKKVSDRHFGIGGDGFILIMPSDKADVRMRMFNADGSEAQMCGNGIRSVAKYVYDHKLVPVGGEFSVPGQGTFAASLRIETGAGVLTVGLLADEDDKARQICVNMGRPLLDPEAIPADLPGESIIDHPLDVGGQVYRITAVSMGNPHAVIFCEDADEIELDQIGPVIENHPAFPERTNVHFVHILGPDEFSMRTWERGSGITLACGTGACACLVAAVLNGKSERVVTAHLPGGDLLLNWLEADGCVYMTGPAEQVFEGNYNAD